MKQLIDLYGSFLNAWTIVLFCSLNGIFNENLYGRFSKKNPHFLHYLPIQNNSLFTKSYCLAFSAINIDARCKVDPLKWIILSNVYYEVLFPSTHVWSEFNASLGFRKSFQHDAIMTHKMFFAHFCVSRMLHEFLQRNFV